jgi:transposase
MRYELADYEWVAIKPILPNKPRGVPRVAANYLAFVQIASIRLWLAAANESAPR